MTIQLVDGPLYYKIGADSPGLGISGAITEVSFDVNTPVKLGQTIAYGNLFNEKWSEQTASQRQLYGPYLYDSDTADEYGEGEIDPRGPGWLRNLKDQFKRKQTAGMHIIELDNVDAYVDYKQQVLDAYNLANQYGLSVIAKNPGLLPWMDEMVKHPNVVGIIVEQGAGSPASMDALRKKNGRPTLPVFFVYFGRYKSLANLRAQLAKPYHAMGVTYSKGGEYTDAQLLQWRGAQ